MELSPHPAGPDGPMVPARRAGLSPLGNWAAPRLPITPVVCFGFHELRLALSERRQPTKGSEPHGFDRS